MQIKNSYRIVEEEAVRLLTSIVQRMTVIRTHEAFVFSFVASPRLHDRLCLWGVETDDLEDEGLNEDDGTAEDDGLDEDDGCSEPSP